MQKCHYINECDKNSTLTSVLRFSVQSLTQRQDTQILMGNDIKFQKHLEDYFSYAMLHFLKFALCHFKSVIEAENGVSSNYVKKRKLCKFYSTNEVWFQIVIIFQFLQ